MDDFGAALAAIRELKEEGVVTEYAVGGAMAHAFWSEPTTTFDLDVFVLLQSSGIITDLGPIYEWARKRGYSCLNHETGSRSRRRRAITQRQA
ncbi:MAG TPA: hypothetical protein VF215_06200 [Thermoanaerobaculia bacterium]